MLFRIFSRLQVNEGKSRLKRCFAFKILILLIILMTRFMGWSRGICGVPSAGGRRPVSGSTDSTDAIDDQAD